MFEFFTNMFSSSSKYIYEEEKNNNNSRSDNAKLLEELISHFELIRGIEIWSEENEKYYYMYYDWGTQYKFVLKESEKSMDKEGVYIDNGKNTYLFEKILELCPNFDKFTITVSNEIKTVNDRGMRYDREPLEFSGWKFNFPIIQNRFFAVSDYTYEKIDKI